MLLFNSENYVDFQQMYYLFNCQLTTIIAFLQELGLIRKPASFMTSICDERGQELLYAGIPITDVSATAHKLTILTKLVACLDKYIYNNYVLYHINYNLLLN